MLIHEKIFQWRVFLKKINIIQSFVIVHNLKYNTKKHTQKMTLKSLTSLPPPIYSLALSDLHDIKLATILNQESTDGPKT